MELHQLNYVVKLASLMHFSKAADELGITQPSLSQQISKLEKELGIKLFDRGTRHVRLTPAGELFVLHANEVLNQMNLLEQVMKEQSAPSTQRLRIATYFSERLDLMNKIMGFQDIYPSIDIHLDVSSGSYEILSRLKKGKIDAGLLFISPQFELDESLTYHTLSRGSINMVINKKHPLALKESVTIDDIANERVIFPSPMYSTHNILLKLYKSSGHYPNVVCEITQLNSIFELVSKNFGISFISSQINDDSSSADVIKIPIVPTIERNLSLVYSKKKSKLETIQKFESFILDKYSL